MSEELAGNLPGLEVPPFTGETGDNGESMPDRDKVADTSQNQAAGRFLVRVRKKLDLLQAEFAAALTRALALNVSQSTLSGWENGTRSVPGAAIEAALVMLGTSLDASFLEPGAASEVADVRREVRKIGEGVARALEVMAGSERRSESSRRVLDVAREIRGLLAEDENTHPSEEENARPARNK